MSIVISCGGDEESSEGPAKAGQVKLDGSKLAGCFADADCKNGLVCYGAVTDSMTATAGFCTDACQTDDPFGAGNVCPNITNFPASCSPEGECRIDCTGTGKGDGKCPSGMECRDADPRDMETAFRCLYPMGTGRGAAKLWAECKPSRGDADCAAPNVCVAFGMGAMARGYCSAPCTNEMECTVPNGVTARPLCPMTLEACSLDCTDGGSCPGGMQCVNTGRAEQPAMRCRYAPAMM